MRLGLISDVHGNRVALDAVLDDMPAVDHLLCAGDVVGYNPWPAECVAAVRDRDVPTVMGNHDRAVASSTPFAFNSMAQAGVEYAREHLDDDALAWLASLPDERTLFDDRVKVVHGHPGDPDRYTYPADFAPGMLGGEDLLVLGHTHVQHHAVFEEGVLVNPGSVGQPRDGDPDAAYAVVDLDDRTVEEHRVTYDVDRVVAAIEEAGLPARLGQRLYEGR
ncbi:metallophosphoesterase [Salinigranum sp.]|uniref:metallophosphoesterase family protein n=1 Tax=Salinigranum sp. TaxID=1966351 RepID=UPI003566A0FC